MAMLVWDPISAHPTSGVNKGVLYPTDGPGVVWNGLISVTEIRDELEIDSLYFDGFNYTQRVSLSEYKATIEAYSFPQEFGASLGFVSLRPGFILTSQPSIPFDFSYCTSTPKGERLHLVYNARPTSDVISHASKNNKSTPVKFKFSITTVPLPATSFRPTSHLIVREEDFSAFDVLTDILYGTDSSNARIPTQDELISLS